MPHGQVRTLFRVPGRLCPHVVEGRSVDLFCKSTNLIREGSTQRPHLLILSPLGVRISTYEFWRGHKHSTLECPYHNLLHFSCFITLCLAKSHPRLCPAPHFYRARSRELSDTGENAHRADWCAYQCTAPNLTEAFGMTGRALLFLSPTPPDSYSTPSSLSSSL